MQSLISIDLKSDFGFFRKPDTNTGINLSYNMLHKPSLLGILGAVIGLEGYKEYGKLPQYYDRLKSLQIGIQPLDHEKGNFIKTIIKYSNTIGYANKGTNYLTEEATLIKPAYRCYLLLELENGDHAKIYQYLKEGKAEYLPYFGKNEFAAWWEPKSFREDYLIEKNPPTEDFNIVSLVCLEDNQEDSINIAFAKATLNPRLRSQHEPDYIYFERLPDELVSSNPKLEKDGKSLYGYGSLKKFVFSNILFEKENRLDIPLIWIAPGKAIHVF